MSFFSIIIGSYLFPKRPWEVQEASVEDIHRDDFSYLGHVVLSLCVLMVSWELSSTT